MEGTRLFQEEEVLLFHSPTEVDSPFCTAESASKSLQSALFLAAQSVTIFAEDAG